LLEPDGEHAIVHVTTVVHVNNALGKLYMFFVAPLHKIIVPCSLKTLAQV
jgi:3-polyprenyl-4-hydroxybenzoate decarboxylase